MGGAHSDAVNFALGHSDMVIGARRDLSKVSDHKNLMVACECGKVGSHCVSDLAADPRIDLIEDQGWRARGKHQPQSEHGASEFAPRRHLGQWLRVVAGIRGEAYGDVVASLSPDSDLKSGTGHSETFKILLNCRREPRRSLGAN